MRNDPIINFLLADEKFISQLRASRIGHKILSLEKLQSASKKEVFDGSLFIAAAYIGVFLFTLTLLSLFNLSEIEKAKWNDYNNGKYKFYFIEKLFQCSGLMIVMITLLIPLKMCVISPFQNGYRYYSAELSFLKNISRKSAIESIDVLTKSDPITYQEIVDVLQELTKTIINIPPEFICPITLDLLTNPVCILSMNDKQKLGSSIEKSALIEWQKNKKEGFVIPGTGNYFDSRYHEIIDDMAMLSQIRDFLSIEINRHTKSHTAIAMSKFKME